MSHAEQVTDPTHDGLVGAKGSDSNGFEPPASPSEAGWEGQTYTLTERCHFVSALMRYAYKQKCDLLARMAHTEGVEPATPWSATRRTQARTPVCWLRTDQSWPQGKRAHCSPTRTRSWNLPGDLSEGKFSRAPGAAPAGHINWQELDAGALHGLRVELHKLHHFERHADGDRQADLCGLSRGKRIVVCPMSPSELGRQLLCFSLLKPWRQELDRTTLHLIKRLFANVCQHKREIEDVFDRFRVARAHNARCRQSHN